MNDGHPGASLAGRPKKSLRTNYRAQVAPPRSQTATKSVTIGHAGERAADTANVRSGRSFANAIRLGLLTAAETGKRTDIVAATDAVERVLRDRRLL